MANWLAGRESVKRAGGINGSGRNAVVDRLIEAASVQIEREARRSFIPRVETRTYRWPPYRPGRAHVLWLDGDLLSVTTLQTRAQDASPVTVASADYFLEPANQGPPYSRIEIDLSSTAALESGDTPQRSISVAGSWGYGQDTRSAGTIASGLSADATATTFVCSDASRVEVGRTLQIESEQLFVSERANAGNGSQLLDGALTASKAEVAVTVDSGAQFNAGEVILVDSERMEVESVSGNVLTVVRAYDGSVLAAHADDTPVHVYRTLTVERGVNGTTAATHADGTAIAVYEPPADIAALCVADALAAYHQEVGGWGRVVGAGDGAREHRTRDLRRGARRRSRATAGRERGPSRQGTPWQDKPCTHTGEATPTSPFEGLLDWGVRGSTSSPRTGRARPAPMLGTGPAAVVPVRANT